MTRSDLYDWLKLHKCEIEPLPEINNTANSIRFVNPKTKGKAYLQSPINNKQVKDYTVCQICTLLGIEIPDCAKGHIELYNHIQDIHSKKK